MPPKIKYKNKYTTAKKLNKIALAKNLINLKRLKNMKVDKPSENASESSCAIEGRRIVELGYLAKSMICCECQNDLLLKNIKNEKVMGLHSILSVACDACPAITQVNTGKVHYVSKISGYEKKTKKIIHYDNTTKAVLGKVYFFFF